MPDIRIARPIPGTDCRPGDIAFEHGNGAIYLMHELTEREVEAIRSNPERLVIFRPSAPWLKLYDQKPARPRRAKAPRGTLRLIRVGEETAHA